MVIPWTGRAGGVLGSCVCACSRSSCGTPVTCRKVGQIAPHPLDISTRTLWIWPYLEKESLLMYKWSILKWDYSGLVWVLHPVTGIFLRKKQRENWDPETQRRRPGEDGGSHKPGTSRGLELQERRKDSPPEPAEGARPCWHRDFRILASKTTRVNLCCFKLPGLW